MALVMDALMSGTCVIATCGRPVKTPGSPAAAGVLCNAHCSRCQATNHGRRYQRNKGGRYTTDNWRRDLEQRVGIEDPFWGAGEAPVALRPPRHVTSEGARA